MDFKKLGLKYLPGAALVLFFAVVYCRPVWDGDYFWHVNTGRWIVENSSLPSTDPFKYSYAALTPRSGEAESTRLYLRCYWLMDVFLYAVDSAAGPSGMVALRIICYSAILLMMLRAMAKNKAGPPGYLATTLLAALLVSFPNERPQLFAFLYFPALLLLLDGLDASSGRGRAVRGAVIAGLMLLWANTHGSYVLGLVILAAYGAGETMEILLKRKDADPNPYLWLLIASAASYANPNGFGMVTEAFRGFGSPHGYIPELVPTITILKNGYFYGAYWGSLALAVLCILVYMRSMKPFHLLVVAGMIALSLSAGRHMAYLPLSFVVLSPYLGRHIKWNVAGYALAVATLATSIYFADKKWPPEMGEDSRFPRAAAAFIGENRPANNILNFYDWGGYLPYRIPGLKVFIDGRNTYQEPKTDFDNMIHTPAWRALFHKYGIETAILPAVNGVTGAPFNLAFDLADSPDWALVYWDRAAVVYVRDIPENRQLISAFEKPYTDFYRHVLLQCDRLFPQRGDRKEFWMTKGIAHMNLAQFRESAYSFARALEIDPNDKDARESLNIAKQRAGIP